MLETADAGITTAIPSSIIPPLPAASSEAQDVKPDTRSRRIRARDIPPDQRLAYTIAEAAALIGVAPISIRRAIERRLIKASRPFRTPLIARSELLRFLAETHTS